MKWWAKAAAQGAGCGVSLGFVLLVGGRLFEPVPVAAQFEQAPEVVKARSFQLVDRQGKVRAELGLDRDEKPSLILRDAAGKDRVGLVVEPDGSPALILSDAAEKVRASLWLESDGNPRLALQDAAGKVRAGLGLTV